MLSATDAACPNLINHSRYMCLLHLCPSKNQPFLLGETDLDRGKKKTLPSTLPKLWIFIHQAQKKTSNVIFVQLPQLTFFSLKKRLDPNSAMTSWTNSENGPSLGSTSIKVHEDLNKTNGLHWLASRTVPPIQKLFRVVYIVNKSKTEKKKNTFVKFHQTSYPPQAAIISL